MSYIIQEEENHPDRLIMRNIGPFDDEDVAWATAKALEDSPDNIIPGYGYKRYWYYVQELIEPKAVTSWLTTYCKHDGFVWPCIDHHTLNPEES